MIYVPPEGSKDASIVIVGQSPGAEEERLKRPFVGPSGTLLMRALQLAGVSRADCYITNVAKHRPPKNDFDVLYWRGTKPAQELIRLRDELLAELSQLPNKKVIVALGKDALWALTGKTQIGKWRGSPIPSELGIVVPTYHPAKVIRQYELEPIMTIDIKKAVRIAFNGVEEVKRHVIMRPTLDDIRQYVNKCFEAGRFAFDIETSMQTIVCIGLSCSREHAIVIPTTIEYWKEPYMLNQALNAIAPLFESRNVVKIAHNAMFDCQYLIRLTGILVNPPIYDTAVAFHCCYMELPKALHFLTSIYTDVVYYKDDLKVWNRAPQDELLWNYNGMDCMVTFEVAEKVDKELRELKVDRVFYDYMMELFYPALWMSLRGIRVDVDELKKAECELREEVERINEGLSFMNVNPRSPKQLAAFIKDTLRLKPVTNENGKVTVNRKALQKLSAKSPVLSKVVELREKEKLLATYVAKPLDIDGRWRYSIKLFGTETLRLSSSSSPFGFGGNIQNIPKSLRRVFIADEGMEMMEVDLKGAEAMVMAYLANDSGMIQVFKDGRNIHAYIASKIFGVSEEEVLNEEGKVMYNKAKRIVHASNYGASWKVLSDVLGTDAKTAKQLLDAYHKNFPSVVRYKESVLNKLRQTRTLTTPFGVKRIFFGRVGNEMLRKALAFVPQETVTHVINNAIIRIHKHYPWIEVLAQVHDAILIQYPEQRRDEVIANLERIFRTDIVINGHMFYIPWEYKYGKHW